MGRALDAAVLTAGAAAALLGAVAARAGHLGVTHGRTLAAGAALAIALAVLVGRARLPRPPLRRVQLALLVGIVLHLVGHLFDLYARFPNYDDVLHAASGAASVALAVDLARGPGFVLDVAHGATRVATLAAVLAFALAGAWELFEFGSDRLFGSREQDDLADTMQDMFDGLAGASVAALVVRRLLAAGEGARRGGTVGAAVADGRRGPR